MFSCGSLVPLLILFLQYIVIPNNKNRYICLTGVGKPPLVVISMISLAASEKWKFVVKTVISIQASERVVISSLFWAALCFGWASVNSDCLVRAVKQRREQRRRRRKKELTRWSNAPGKKQREQTAPINTIVRGDNGGKQAIIGRTHFFFDRLLFPGFCIHLLWCNQ